jgi:hypothetical protein
LQAGTEDGYINIFTVTDENLMYEKILDKQEGKCGTSSGFHPLSDLLYKILIYSVLDSGCHHILS